jgi:hypothetical protein
MARDESQGPPELEGAGVFLHLREVVTDSLRYWERRRIFYNLVLAVIVGAHVMAAWPRSRSALTVDGVLRLFVLAVLANVAYSAVYVADVFIQVSGFRDGRAGWRWILLAVGFTFAAVLAHFVSAGLFSRPHA